MSFKFDGQKVKANMEKKLGYAQAQSTKFIEKAKSITKQDIKSGAQYVADSTKAGAETAKDMFNKSATGKKINAHGKGLVGGAKKVLSQGAKTVARVNPAVGLAVFAGITAAGTVRRIRNRRENRKKNA